MDWKTEGPRTLAIYLTTVVSNICKFAQMFFNTMQVHRMLPHISTTVAHESQTSICFALQPGVLELHGILRQLHWITPMTLNTMTSKVPHVFSTSPHESTFHPVCSLIRYFRNIGNVHFLVVHNVKF